MTCLIDVQTQLQDTTAAIAQLERAIVNDPESSALRLQARSLHKRKRALEEQFLAAAQTAGRDVCSYRILTDSQRSSIAAMSSALLSFQTLITIIYDVIKHGPKQRLQPNPDAQSETAFGFGYAFPGSLGIVLTLANERLLFGESDLDESIRLFCEMAAARETNDLVQFSRRLGLAPVRAMYRWTQEHVRHNLGAAIQWRRGNAVQRELLMQRPEMEKLEQTIARTSEESTESLKVHGQLLGADIQPKRFHLRSDSGTDIRGTFDDAISPSHSVELPKRYMATLLKTTVVHYSTEQEDVKYHLAQLEPYSSPVGIHTGDASVEAEMSLHAQ